MSNEHNLEQHHSSLESPVSEADVLKKIIAAERTIRTGRLCAPSDDIVAVPVTEAQAKALKMQADIAGIATLEPTQARHVAGQAAFVNPRLAHLMALAAALDDRGFEAVLNCALFHRRYPKGE